MSGTSRPSSPYTLEQTPPPPPLQTPPPPPPQHSPPPVQRQQHPSSIVWSDSSDDDIQDHGTIHVETPTLLGETKSNSNHVEQENLRKCTVCYEVLTIDNIVNTQCNHLYCWECFFKWIKTNPTCPYCRCDFLSEEAWYQNRDIETDATNMRAMVNMLQLDLVRASTQIKHFRREQSKITDLLKYLKKERTQYLRSVISLKEQIDYMRGYHSALRGDIKDKDFAKRNMDAPWFRGFTYGIYEVIQSKNEIDYNKLNYFIQNKCNPLPGFKIIKEEDGTHTHVNNISGESKQISLNQWHQNNINEINKVP